MSSVEKFNIHKKNGYDRTTYMLEVIAWELKKFLKFLCVLDYIIVTLNIRVCIEKMHIYRK